MQSMEYIINTRRLVLSNLDELFADVKVSWQVDWAWKNGRGNIEFEPHGEPVPFTPSRQPSVLGFTFDTDTGVVEFGDTPELFTRWHDKQVERMRADGVL